MSSPAAKIGPYVLSECLESGSSVQLWLAQREGVYFAVRLVVDPADDLAIARWRSELELLQSTQSASLPAIEAVFDDEKAFVLEWGSGGGLDDLVRGVEEGGETWSIEDAVALGLSLLETLNELPGHHGNLCPKNIRKRSDGRLCVYAFGAQPERVAPRYMPPEMAGQGQLGLATDQWHVAVLLFELVLGRPLYPGDWSESFRAALDADTTGALKQLRKRSTGLANALGPALRENGAQGFETHAQMALALQGALDSTEEGAPSDTELEASSEVPLARVEPEPPPEIEAPSIAEEQLTVGLDTAAEELHDDALPLVAEDTQSEFLEPEEPVDTRPVPQLERVEIAQVAGDEQAPDEELQGRGLLGVPITSQERAVFSACQGAVPVERGSWWVSKSGEQTLLPQQQTSVADEAPVEESEVLSIGSEVVEAPPVEEEKVPSLDEIPRMEAPQEAVLQFNDLEDKPIEPPVLDELPALDGEGTGSSEPLAPLRLPGIQAVSEVLEEELLEEAEGDEDDLPWDQPEVVIPAPPKPLSVETSPQVPDILSPRRIASPDRSERMAWEQSWATRSLSEQIARGGLLVLLGMGLAWLVFG